MGSSSSNSGKNTTAAVATSRSRGSPSRPARSSRTEKVAPPVKGSLDRERFFRQAFRRGDELRDSLFRIGQDRMAAPEEGQALLQHRDDAIQRKIPAGQQLPHSPEEVEGV